LSSHSVRIPRVHMRRSRSLVGSALTLGVLVLALILSTARSASALSCPVGPSGKVTCRLDAVSRYLEDPQPVCQFVYKACLMDGSVRPARTVAPKANHTVARTAAEKSPQPVCVVYKACLVHGSARPAHTTARTSAHTVARKAHTTARKTTHKPAPKLCVTPYSNVRVRCR